MPYLDILRRSITIDVEADFRHLSCISHIYALVLLWFVMIASYQGPIWINLNHLPIFFGVASLALVQSYYCPSSIAVTLKYEAKTVCTKPQQNITKRKPESWKYLLYVKCWCHDDVIKWKHFPRYWPFVRGIHRSPVNSPHKGQWRAALMFTLICARINGWVNNREAGDLRRYRAHYDVIVMWLQGLHNFLESGHKQYGKTYG